MLKTYQKCGDTTPYHRQKFMWTFSEILTIETFCDDWYEAFTVKNLSKALVQCNGYLQSFNFWRKPLLLRFDEMSLLLYEFDDVHETLCALRRQLDRFAKKTLLVKVISKIGVLRRCIK
ncbi:MAG: hypothetical protein FWC13_01840 [Oscillospiraceae bacterium]|nr:hypothetical protein [Oscillospiraceae bacterium]